MAFRGGVRGATIKLLDLEAALAFLRRRPDASAFILRWIKPPGSAFGGGTFDVAFNFGGGRAFVVALVVAAILDNAGGRAGGDGGTAAQPSVAGAGPPTVMRIRASSPRRPAKPLPMDTMPWLPTLSEALHPPSISVQRHQPQPPS